MKKVLEKPSPKNRNGSFGKATLRSPGMGFHHANLLKGPLLSEWLVNDFKPGCFAPCRAWCNGIFLSHSFSGGLNLFHDSIFQTPKMARHGSQSQSRVNRGCPVTRHCFKGGDHSLHLVTVMFVSSINLRQQKVWASKRKVIYKFHFESYGHLGIEWIFARFSLK